MNLVEMFYSDEWSEWKENIVLASVPLWKYSDLNVPIANASGCLVDYKGSRFILSVAHSSIAGSTWQMEIGINRDLEGKWGLFTQPIGMDFLEQFSVDFENDTITDNVLIDFTYKKIPDDMSSYHVLEILKDQKANHALRTIFKTDFKIKPSSNKKYGFYGKVRFAVEGDKILYEDRLEDSLTYRGKDGDYFIFELPHKYGSHLNYVGCSGAPIIDEENNVVALVTKGDRNKNCIYGIDIEKYKIALDIDIQQTKRQ